MNSLKITSIALLVFGFIIFVIGLILFWTVSSPTSNAWASVSIMLGVIIILASIIFLCLSHHYESQNQL